MSEPTIQLQCHDCGAYVEALRRLHAATCDDCGGFMGIVRNELGRPELAPINMHAGLGIASHWEVRQQYIDRVCRETLDGIIRDMRYGDEADSD